ncbi:hypothetical protein QCA50_014133 [Cerrena zonata]|uniref:Uncharacterized protein n=1 Tax=Cerrena zonata TaxID=2478898 RepID=A0AAW0G135_9APHY
MAKCGMSRTGTCSPPLPDTTTCPGIYPFHLTAGVSLQASEDWTVSVWDAKPDSTVSICDSFIGTRPLLLRHVKSTSTSGCYSLDSEFIVTGYEEGSINVRSTRRGTLADLKGHREKVKFVTVTADNKYIVSAFEDDSIRIWSLEDICRLATAL